MNKNNRLKAFPTWSDQPGGGWDGGGGGGGVGGGT